MTLSARPVIRCWRLAKSAAVTTIFRSPRAALIRGSPPISNCRATGVRTPEYDPSSSAKRILDFAPGPFSSATNTGTLRKPAGPGASTVPRLVNNSGAVEVLSGTLTLQGGSGTGGTWNVSGGAVLDRNGTSTASQFPPC